MNDKTFEDAFNLLCGAQIGDGIHRTVFECRIRPDLVVKVEDSEWRDFANVREMKFWVNWQHVKSVVKWLAPCEFLSPDGRILLQKKARILTKDDPLLPKKLPRFLTDTKHSNYGVYEGRVVCVDYASTVDSVETKRRKPEWFNI